MAAPHPSDPPWQMVTRTSLLPPVFPVQSTTSPPLRIATLGGLCRAMGALLSRLARMVLLWLLLASPCMRAQMDVTPPAPFTRFDAIPEVGRWLRDLSARGGSFSVAALARAEHAHLASRMHPAAPAKPSSMDVRAMYSAHHCRAGRLPLPRGDNALLLPGFVRLHRAHCAECAALPRGTGPTCYFAQLYRCLSHGFDPPRVTTAAPRPLYLARGADGNHPSTAAFSGFVDDQVTKLRAGGVILPAPPYTIQAPLGVAIPPSKAQAAYSLTGVAAVDDASYARAKELLAHLVPGFEELFKRRLISDHSAPGLNAQMDLKAFSYIAIDDMVAMIRPGMWVAVADVVAYYHNFPLALEARHLFGLRWRGLAYVWGRLSFGGSAHPYLASVVTAEIVAGLRGMGIPAVAMIDDFGTVGESKALAVSRLQVLCEVIRSLGLAVAPDKTKLGQQIKFIGFWIDTVRMVVAFDKVSSAAFAEVLRNAMWCLASGQQWDHLFVLHVAGKLQHFASVVQAGRLRLAPLWAYARLRGRLSDGGISRLLDDLAWWEKRLRWWASDELGGGEFPILNAATLLDDPQAMLIAVTDYSGPDGVGGYFGRLDDSDPEVFSRQWESDECPNSSLAGELFGLLFLLRLLTARNPHPVCKVILWVTDNMGAAFVINAGRCSDDQDGLAFLRLIFDALEGLGWFIVALWHPREANTLADFYSHLSRYLDVAAVSTSVSRVAIAQGPRVAGAADQGSGGGPSDVEVVRSVVCTDGSLTPASLRDGGGVPVRVRGAPARIDAVGGADQVPPQENGHAQQVRLAVSTERSQAGRPHAADAVRGPHERAADGPHADADAQQGAEHVGSGQPCHAGAGDPRQDGTTRASPGRGGHMWAARERRVLEGASASRDHAFPPHQARAHWCRAVRHRRAGRQGPLLGGAAPSTAVARAGAGRSPGAVRVPSRARGAHRSDPSFLGPSPSSAGEAHRLRGRGGPSRLREPLPPRGRDDGSAGSRGLRDGGAEDGPVEVGHL